MKKILFVVFATLSINLLGQDASRLTPIDTRNTNEDPTFYSSELRLELKNRSALNVPGTGTYTGLLTISPVIATSGSNDYQLNFNPGGIYFRDGLSESSTWSNWEKILTEEHSFYSFDLLDSRNLNSNPTEYSNEVRFERKANSVLGLNGGDYSGLMTIAPFSGAGNLVDYQLDFNTDGLYYRTGDAEGNTWGNWDKVMTESQNLYTLDLMTANQNVDTSPQGYSKEVRFERKLNAPLGLTGGDYSALVTIAPLSGSGNNKKDYQLNFNTGGLYYRVGDAEAVSWGDWDKILTESSGVSSSPWSTINSSIRFDGDVGIGTDPSEKLTVDGKIRSEEVKVEIINGPDYVFESDYELRTLKETKEYITANKHLPEIPSAKEMEANGIELGDMNMMLLKKIEELTLHLIEQNERMEKLEKEVSTLKNN